MQRIVVVGTTGSGKTTLASQLAGLLGLPHIEMDALHWEANWQQAQLDVFRARISEATSGAAWVLDGNYSKARDIVWARADTLVWLDYSFLTIMRRLLRRTIKRVITREELWHGNRESLRALFGKDSLILWMIRSYPRRRRTYPVLLKQPENAHLTIVRLPAPQAAQTWLASLQPEPSLAFQDS